MNATFSTINDDACETYAELGAVCLRDVFTDWVGLLRAGVERNHDEPGPYFSENVVGEGDGRFWDDYCNWQRIPEFHRFITESNAAQYAAQIMRSKTAQFNQHPGIRTHLIISLTARKRSASGCRLMW
jgi:ectoine hydroxylase-related dioxygenase (phytanoyl-CoA dioxygenase family)